MAKKQNKPTKTCADCIHESACRGWTSGRYISDVSASQCPNHETVKESGAYRFLDRKKPCLCIEEGNSIVVYGHFNTFEGAEEFMNRLGKFIGARMDGSDNDV